VCVSRQKKPPETIFSHASWDLVEGTKKKWEKRQKLKR